jgi:hypothetical protein
MNRNWSSFTTGSATRFAGRLSGPDSPSAIRNQKPLSAWHSIESPQRANGKIARVSLRDARPVEPVREQRPALGALVELRPPDRRDARDDGE